MYAGEPCGLSKDLDHEESNVSDDTEDVGELIISGDEDAGEQNMSDDLFADADVQKQSLSPDELD